MVGGTVVVGGIVVVVTTVVEVVGTVVGIGTTHSKVDEEGLGPLESPTDTPESPAVAP